ncbi:tetratricopeptide repeat protein [Frigoriglobus tundricola]|uniref:Protein kinase domain-containing protein n=1 Tax=Frigoriglobus tundricola TaxID=2774151 RepID=A0A6M5YN38_9BACT|nr:tetratricopeptide repeat protein [Frigoriglobus tundricola]QJW95457.1 hypothetical protein FTUN_3006 [Frigoriglobus tundricola]
MSNHPPTNPSPAAGRYQLGAEIARRDTGVIYRATDTVFGRTVAVKVLTEPLGSARVADEARTAGRLQHPAVPAVHDFGTLPDGRPFLALNLITGRTLDGLLAERPDPTHDRDRFMMVFEQVCQALAYAHAHRIVHNDLRASNVLVGSFGEVQIMDWGRAKVLESGTRQRSGPVTVPPKSNGSAARPAPEPARGGPSDARADVFGLGALLAVILTGEPVFASQTEAARGQLAACFARLDRCGAEPEWVALCKRCLAPKAADRPADAGAVARSVVAYRTGGIARARRGERKLAGAIVLLLLVGGSLAWWADRQASARKIRAETALADQARIEAETRTKLERIAAEQTQAESPREPVPSAALRGAESRTKARQADRGIELGLNLATTLRKQHKFQDAEAALALVAELAQTDAPDRRAEVEQARSDVVFVTKLDGIRYRKWIWIVERHGAGQFNARSAAPEYRAAFMVRGLDVATLDPVEAAQKIAASPVKAELVAALDDWAVHEPEPGLQNRLLEVARRADPAPWTDALRSPAVRSDKSEVEKLAAGADSADVPPTALAVLARLMVRHGLNPAPLLASARAKHPTDCELALLLGLWYSGATKGRNEGVIAEPDSGSAPRPRGDGDRAAQAISAYEAARVLRPDLYVVWVGLGAALAASGEPQGAVAAYKRAVQLEPSDARAHDGLGAALDAAGDHDAAVAAFNRAIEIDPKSARAYNDLGLALYHKKDTAGAVAAFNEAIRLAPAVAVGYHNLGVALRASASFDGAVAAHKRAVELEPQNAVAHNELGLSFRARNANGDLDAAVASFVRAVALAPGYARAYNNLGLALFAGGNIRGALAASARAVQLDPQLAQAHYNLARALDNMGDSTSAAVALEWAAALDPRYGKPPYELGITARAKDARDIQEKMAGAFKGLILQNPKYAKAHADLGSAFLQKKNYSEAITCARAAVTVDPAFAEGHALLGLALEQTGDLPGARAALTEAARLDPRWAAQLAKLPSGTAAPPPHEIRR